MKGGWERGKGKEERGITVVASSYTRKYESDELRCVWYYDTMLDWKAITARHCRTGEGVLEAWITKREGGDRGGGYSLETRH